VSATWEEARHCPKCGEAGEARGGARATAKPGVKAQTVYCLNERCSWFSTGWVVQINPDGSIPDAAPTGIARGEKLYGEENLLTSGVTDAMVEKINREATGMDTPGRRELG
jgi:hypothetical protein